MLITLLAVTFVVCLIVASIVVKIFNKAVKDILVKILGTEISDAWAKYIFFAMHVSGLSNGVRIWEFEKYLYTYSSPDYNVPVLDFNRWTFELTRSVLEALSAISMVLFVFFIFALIALVVIRILEVKLLKTKQNISNSDTVTQ